VGARARFVPEYPHLSNQTAKHRTPMIWTTRKRLRHIAGGSAGNLVEKEDKGSDSFLLFVPRFAFRSAVS
jgi:hypothetical protein